MSGIMCAVVGSSGSTLTSVTFTANGTWVAPTGVSNVISASGKGSNGVSDYYGVTSFSAYVVSQSYGTEPNAPYAQWATLYNNYVTTLSAYAALTYPHYAPTSPLPLGSFTYVDTSNNWHNDTYTFVSAAYYLSSYRTYTTGSPATSGNITYSDGPSGWWIETSGIVPGGAGTASTALGQTFPGGAYIGTYPSGIGLAATTTTYTNVAVTPGNSYSIVVPSGGTVTLQYYA